MFFGRNFKAVFDIRSSRGSFFCSFLIMLAIVPDVIKIFEVKNYITFGYRLL